MGTETLNLEYELSGGFGDHVTTLCITVVYEKGFPCHGETPDEPGNYGIGSVVEKDTGKVIQLENLPEAIAKGIETFVDIKMEKGVL